MCSLWACERAVKSVSVCDGTEGRTLPLCCRSCWGVSAVHWMPALATRSILSPTLPQCTPALTECTYTHTHKQMCIHTNPHTQPQRTNTPYIHLISPSAWNFHPHKHIHTRKSPWKYCSSQQPTHTHEHVIISLAPTHICRPISIPYIIICASPSLTYLQY